VTERNRQSGTMSLRRKTGAISNGAERVDRCKTALMLKYTKQCTGPDSKLNLDMIAIGIDNVQGSKPEKCERLAIEMIKLGKW
jgi:hypothetical protein